MEVQLAGVSTHRTGLSRHPVAFHLKDDDRKVHPPADRHVCDIDPGVRDAIEMLQLTSRWCRLYRPDAGVCLGEAWWCSRFTLRQRYKPRGTQHETTWHRRNYCTTAVQHEQPSDSEVRLFRDGGWNCKFSLEPSAIPNLRWSGCPT